MEWYETCSRAEAMSQGDSFSDGGEDTDRSDGLDAGSDHGPDCGSAEGGLPGAPASGSMLAEFLGREVRFAFKCATDKVGILTLYRVTVLCNTARMARKRF